MPRHYITCAILFVLTNFLPNNAAWHLQVMRSIRWSGSIQVESISRRDSLMYQYQSTLLRGTYYSPMEIVHGQPHATRMTHRVKPRTLLPYQGTVCNGQLPSCKNITSQLIRYISLSSVISAYNISLEYYNSKSSRCICPFHSDHNPSMLINEIPGYYYCFTCQASGNAVSFISKLENTSYTQVAHVCYKILSEKLSSHHVGNFIFNIDPLSSYKLYKKLAHKIRLKDNTREGDWMTPKPPLGKPSNRATRSNSFMIIEKDPTFQNSEITTISRQKAISINKYACDYFMTHLLYNPQAENVRNYLKKRSISLKTAVEFQLGYAPEGIPFTIPSQSVSYSQPELKWLENNAVSSNRWPIVAGKSLATYLKDLSTTNAVQLEDLIVCGLIKNNTAYSTTRPFIERFRNRLIVPIRNEEKQIIAFGARLVQTDGTLATPHKYRNNQLKKAIRAAKYINSPTSPVFQKKLTLFGIENAMRYAAQQNFVLMVEGYFDVLALYESGIKNVVATMGTSVTAQQLSKASSLSNSGTIILLLDSDDAGHAATDRAIEVIKKANCDVRERKTETAIGAIVNLGQIHLRRGSIASALPFIIQNKLVSKLSSDISSIDLKDCADIHENFHHRDVQRIIDHIVRSSVEVYPRP